MVRIHDRPFLRPRLLPGRIRGLVLAALIVATLLAAGRAAAQPLTVGAYYYPWYGANGAQWDRGFERSELDPPELPLLGEYDSSDPAVIAQHYEWAQSYGVDVFFCSWAWTGLVRRRRHPQRPAAVAGAWADADLDPVRVAASVFPSTRTVSIQLDDAAIATMVVRLRLSRADVSHAAGVLPHRRAAGGGDLRVAGLPRQGGGGDPGDPHASRGGVRIRSVSRRRRGRLGSRARTRARIQLYDAITGYTPYSRTQSAGLARRHRLRDRDGGTDARSSAQSPPRSASLSSQTALPGFDDLGVRPEVVHHVLPRALGPGERAGLDVHELGSRLPARSATCRST